MPRMTRLPSDLRRWGLVVALVKGWETRGSSSFAPGMVRNHWTGTAQRAGVNLPTLRVLINGHGSLPGPLCQVAHGRDGSCTVVAAGRANDGGPGLWEGITGNSGGYGIESEANGPRSWTPEQRFTYPIVVAALLHGLGRGAEWDASHAEFARPKGRKSDINGWPDGGMDGFRRRVQALLDAGPDASPLHHYRDVEAAIAALGSDPIPVTSEEDDMAITPEDLATIIRKEVTEVVGTALDYPARRASQANDLLSHGIGPDPLDPSRTATVGGVLLAVRRDSSEARLHSRTAVVAAREAIAAQLTPAAVALAVEGLDIPGATVDEAVQRIVNLVNGVVNDVELPVPDVGLPPVDATPTTPAAS